MKNKVKKELRQKNAAELIDELAVKRAELVKASMYMVDERNKNKMKNLKKAIAIMATMIKEKEEQ